MSDSHNRNADVQANNVRILAGIKGKQREKQLHEEKQEEQRNTQYDAQLELEKKSTVCNECEICCESRASRRFVTCDDRRKSHSFCEVCVRQHLRETIFEKGSPWMRCLGTDCVAFYKRADYERILDQDAIKMRNRLETRASLKNVKGMTACPACDFAAFVEPDRRVFDCLNTACLKSFCLNCNAAPHFGKSCQRAREEKQKAAAADVESNPGQGRDDLRRKVEEYISDALIRKCCDCNVSFVKDNGCNEMHCICGNVSCYACKEQHIGHSHWFRGTCKQFESTELREEMERKEAERLAIAKVKRENPGVTDEDLKIKEFSASVKHDDRMRKAKEKVLLQGGAWHPGMPVDDADPDTMADIAAQMAGVHFGGAATDFSAAVDRGTQPAVLGSNPPMNAFGRGAEGLYRGFGVGDMGSGGINRGHISAAFVPGDLIGVHSTFVGTQRPFVPAEWELDTEIYGERYQLYEALGAGYWPGSFRTRGIRLPPASLEVTANIPLEDDVYGQQFPGGHIEFGRDRHFRRRGGRYAFRW